MLYSPESMAEMQERSSYWRRRGAELGEKFLFRTYRDSRSSVLASQGLGRRLDTLVRCVESVFRIIPPDASEPTRDDMHDAEIYLQAFLINLYGAQDNLARIWVWESGLKKPNGGELPSSFMGLDPGKEMIRNSLSATANAALSKLDGWFGYVENYRHALAHRIPLYIPPRQLQPDEFIQYQVLDSMAQTASANHDYDGWTYLTGEKNNLGTFEPLMVHSYGDIDDGGPPVKFHAQVLIDLATIVEIGEVIFDELAQLP